MTQIILGKQGEQNNCRLPGSLHCQFISNHHIKVNYICFCHPWRWMSVSLYPLSDEDWYEIKIQLQNLMKKLRMKRINITGVSIVCSTVRSGADQRKHQSSASLAFVREIHMCQWTGSALVQVMTCRLFYAKPLSEPMLGHHQFNH